MHSSQTACSFRASAVLSLHLCMHSGSRCTSCGRSHEATGTMRKRVDVLRSQQVVQVSNGGE